MNATIKIGAAMLDAIRRDLERRHAFAWERVGFITAACAGTASGILLLARSYTPVADADYERASGVGAQIGSDAMRKALQSAYRPQHALLHIHTHGGSGIPAFSGTDCRSADEFVPSFFNALPRMPHGIIVLSDDAAAGSLWLAPDRSPIPVARFVRVGAPYSHSWSKA
jgi:hypothetical protein